jgi:hypothetical protein
MLRQGLLAVAVLGVMGCNGNDRARVTETQKAAMAATAQYPQDAQVTEDMRATVLVQRDGERIRIINASDQAIRDARIWINGSYVANLDSLGPRSIVTLRRGDFYNDNGRTLAMEGATVQRVELQSNNQLHRLYGPVFE